MDWVALKTGADATSNPAPNSLGVVAPISITTGQTSPTAAWTAQGNIALFPEGSGRQGIGGQYPLWVLFKPGNGDAVTYTVTAWRYVRTASTWVRVAGTHSNSYQGFKSDYISYPGRDPIFLQLSSISAGTIDIYYDRDYATAG